MSSLTYYILLAVAVLALVDYLPRLIIKAKRHTAIAEGRGRTPDYRIIATVYGDISYLQNVEFLRKYRKNVIIATSKYESNEFYADLESVCSVEGFKYVRADVPVASNGIPVRNAYTIYAGIFRDLSNSRIRPNTVCLLIDADTYTLDSVNDLIRTYKNSKHHIASLRCEVDNPVTVVQKLQALEYRTAMDNRLMDTWLTSGACNIANADTYQKIFERHSSYFAGGDIEIGKIAAVMGMNVGHINFTFYTVAPDRWIDWYKQRIIWFAGGFRHHVTNIGSFGWYHFFMLFYNSLIIYLLLPLRWIEMIHVPQLFVVLIFISYFYLFMFVTGRTWRKEYFILPFYSAFQSMIILPIAICRYFTYVYKQRSFGILRYNLKRFTIADRLNFALLNTGSAGMVVLLAVLLTGDRISYWAEHSWVVQLIGSLL